MEETRPEAMDIIEQSTKRQHFTDVRHVTVRWEPYKPDGARQMKAKGRWQEQVGTGDYWRWQNCARPAFAHDPHEENERDALCAELARVTAEQNRLRNALAELVEEVQYFLGGFDVGKPYYPERMRDSANHARSIAGEGRL